MLRISGGNLGIGPAVMLAGQRAAVSPSAAVPTPHVGTVHHIRFTGSLGPGQPVRQTGLSLYFAGARRKLMSYNAENFYRTRNGISKEPAAVQALAKIILDEDPDVIALQEVGDKRFLEDFNRKHLKGRYPKVISFPTKDHGIRVAMMCKRNIRVVEAKSHWKEQCGGKNDCGKRDFLEATFETDTGYRFTVYDAHFKSMVGSHQKQLREQGQWAAMLRDPSRKQDVERIQRADEQETMPIRLGEARTGGRLVRERLSRDPQSRIFVTGDINTRHDTEYGKPVLQALSLADDKDPANDLTEVMLKDNNPKPTHYGKGLYANNKLDYTFVSPALLKEVVEAYVVGEFKEPWITASDHLPLVTVFEEPDAVAKSARKPTRREFWDDKQVRKYGYRRRLDYTA